MTKNFISICFISFSYLTINCAQVQNNPEITSEEIKEHISYLASDELKGRFTGTDECLQAAEYIEKEFRSYGLLPFFGDSYLQKFPFTADIELTDNNKLSIASGDIKISPKLYEDFAPLSFSGKTNTSGKLVFAGYGISVPDIGYDDYEGIDITGKIVLVLRDHPEMDIPHSKFDEYSPLRKKAMVARDKGALAIIFVNGYNPHNTNDELVQLSYDHAGSMDDFAVLNIKREIAEKIFDLQSLKLKDYQDKIKESLKPASFKFENVTTTLSTELQPIGKESWNVAGLIEGNDPQLKNQYIIVGAHFDHLGMGGRNSLYTGNAPQVHNGADDNASGTTGVFELAEIFYIVLPCFIIPLFCINIPEITLNRVLLPQPEGPSIR